VKFVAVRLVQLVVVLLAATFFTYSLTFIANTPEEVVNGLLQIEAGAPERRAAIEEDLNLNDPLLVRYGKWLGNAATGDLGRSYSTQEPVMDRIERRLPRTLALVFYAQIIALGLAIPAGIISAWRADSLLDRGLSSTSIGLLAVPNYVLAVLLVYFFALQLGWFPSLTASDLSIFDFKSYVLPATSLALGQVAVYMRLLRTDMIATLQEDFIGMAKAKGLTTRSILFRHALRPSSLSLVTTIGINAGAALGGTVIIETIFGMPGMGTMLVDAIFRRDVLVVQGVVAVIAVGFVVINFLIDLLYALLDPRIRSVRSAA
jgi:peptide/nickel transport system permease protein